jgi:hypothetical protein
MLILKPLFIVLESEIDLIAKLKLTICVIDQLVASLCPALYGVFAVLRVFSRLAWHDPPLFVPWGILVGNCYY